MKQILVILSIVWLGLVYSGSVYSETVKAAVDCSLPQGATSGKPLVKVEPETTSSIPDGSCVLVSFMLKDKPGADGQALIPTSIKIEQSTNRALSRAVRSAVAKWLYLSKSHSKETKYYYSFVSQSE